MGNPIGVFSGATGGDGDSPGKGAGAPTSGGVGTPRRSSVRRLLDSARTGWRPAGAGGGKSRYGESPRLKAANRGRRASSRRG